MLSMLSAAGFETVTKYARGPNAFGSDQYSELENCLPRTSKLQNEKQCFYHKSLMLWFPAVYTCILAKQNPKKPTNHRDYIKFYFSF